MTSWKPLLAALLLALGPGAAAAQSASHTTAELDAALARSDERLPTTLALGDALQRALADNLGLQARIREQCCGIIPAIIMPPPPPPTPCCGCCCCGKPPPLPPPLPPPFMPPPFIPPPC